MDPSSVLPSDVSRYAVAVVAYALVLLGIVGYVASLAVRARALGMRADALRPGASRRA